jgi:hypothetical protein
VIFIPTSACIALVLQQGNLMLKDDSNFDCHLPALSMSLKCEERDITEFSKVKCRAY